MSRRCECGIDREDCYRQQRREQCADSCEARCEARLEEEGFTCPWCGERCLHEDGYAPDEAEGDLICEACATSDRRAIMQIDRCPDCDEPTHATESDDTGRCAKCRACHYCDAEATRDGIERDADGGARTYRVCEACGESSDRAEKAYRYLSEHEWI